MKLFKNPRPPDKKSGATVVIVAIALVLIISFAALAVDIGNFYVVLNELQNAADAGALAGSRNLYLESGEMVNTGANQISADAAMANMAANLPVEVNLPNDNLHDVQRGHWSFGLTAEVSKGFYPNASTAPVDLFARTDEDLDKDLNFINAVRVVARREATPLLTYFAKIFGFDDFKMNAEAVAYIGFSGKLLPGEADQPIVICAESITSGGAYECNVGRMINSGSEVGTANTGGWTSFNQEDPCTGGTNAQEVRNLVCGTGNPIVITGGNIATSGGEIQTAFADLYNCWVTNTSRTAPWNLTLPVVTCPSNNVGVCENVVGAVNLNVIWMLETEPTNQAQYDSDIPGEMGEVTYTDEHGNVVVTTEAWPTGKTEGGGEWDRPLNQADPYVDPELPADDPRTKSVYQIMTELGYLEGTYSVNVAQFLLDEYGADWQSQPLSNYYAPNRPETKNSKIAAAHVRWASFVSHYGLVNVGTPSPPSPFAQKSIYFLPDCGYHETKGVTGGSNFGVLAKIPVLVD